MIAPCRSILASALLLAVIAACDRAQPPAQTPAPVAASQPEQISTLGVDPSIPRDAVEPAREGETADHAKSDTKPPEVMTRKEESSAMPMPGQANDHSTLALDPKN